MRITTVATAALVLAAGRAGHADEPEEVAVVALGAIAETEPFQLQLSGAAAAGGGFDRTLGDSSGFAAGRAWLIARLTRPAPAPIERGLRFITDNGFVMWAFTGIDHGDHDGLYASADATTHVVRGTELADAVWLTARAYARLAGWQLEGRSVFQPIGSLQDKFWRSGRGVFQNNVAVDIAPMWSIGSATRQLIVGAMRVDLGHRFEPGTNPHFDRDFSLRFLRYQQPAVSFDFCDVRFIEFGVAERTVDGTTFGTSVVSVDVDLGKLAWRVRDDLEVGARGGFALRSPLAPYEQTGSSSTSKGPLTAAGTYWGAVRYGTALDDAATGHVVSFGAGRWLRIDPSGHAVDEGHLATVALDWRPTERHHAKLAVELGRLDRFSVGDMAPPEVAPEGTAMWMGRTSGEVGYLLTRSIGVTAGAWLERSDRDDPRWIDPATGAVATHAGAEVTAEVRFDTPR